MLATWTVEWAERHGTKRVVLATLDAHGEYPKAGVNPVGHPERWMKIDTRPPVGQGTRSGSHPRGRRDAV